MCFGSGPIFPKSNFMFCDQFQKFKQSLEFSFALTAKRAANEKTIYVNLKNLSKGKEAINFMFNKKHKHFKV
jgi:hypothetical protein